MFISLGMLWVIMIPFEVAPKIRTGC
jgi:hypothetical protein